MQAVAFQSIQTSLTQTVTLPDKMNRSWIYDLPILYL